MSVTVSILAYERLDVTKRCLQSVLRYGGYDRLILTDNGSQDKGVLAYFQAIAALDPRITIVANPENLGFVEPNRRALAMTTTPYFLMLNNDTIIHDYNWIEQLVKPLEGNELAALSGPEECASRLDPNASGYRCRPADMEYLEGSCLCCKVFVVKKHGLFADWCHFAYCEDSDLGLRMRQIGYTLHTAPIHVTHEGGATSALVPGIRHIEDANKVKMRQHWGAYLQTRSFKFAIVINRQGALGDVLLITPIITAISKRFPDSPIYVETQAVDIFLYNSKVKLASRSRIEPGIPCVRINLDMSYENMPGVHIVEAYRRTASAVLGDELEVCMKTEMSIDLDVVTPFNDPGGIEFKKKFDLSKEWIAIHCEPTTWPGKNWPSGRWIELLWWLKEQGFAVVIVGNSKAQLVECDVDMREQTSPLDLAALLWMAKLFIGHDSFPMHVAQSQGVPTIGLFGATRSEFILTAGSRAIGIDGTGPCAGERHRVSGATFVPCDGACMRSITVEQVKAAVLEIMR